jgi:phage terminase large subunit
MSVPVHKIVVGGMKYRDYQRPVVRYFDNGGRRASLIWHRRSGKDRTLLNVICRMAMKRVGLYWHCLPTHKQAKKVVWDNITRDGKRLIDVTFPPEIRKATNETELKITLKNGSVVQLVGADNFDSLIGANPVGIVFSEYAVTHPRAWDLMRPILAENDGWAAFVTTPRGYNHAYKLHEAMKSNPDCYTSLLTVDDTGGIVTAAVIEEERRLGMPEEMIRQEFYCDFSAANVGAILGRYIEQADKEGRISMDVRYDPLAGPVHVSCDIGYSDAAAFWFWQPYTDAYALIDYYEDTGLDAEDWIERLAMLPYAIEDFYLPHDARAKTFATKHSVIQQFIDAKKSGQLNVKNMKVVPRTNLQDRVNAARHVLPSCRFDAAACAQGLASLREWSFKYDEERRCYSAEPDHNWASHGADGFTYGAQMIGKKALPKVTQPTKYAVPMTHSFNLEDLFAERERTRRGGFQRIEL